MAAKLTYLAVTGTMGSGKTTAAKLLAKHLKYHLLGENFGQNAFLSRFYKDMKRWAFHSQTFFLMEKISQMLGAAGQLQHRTIIQDVPIQQDVFSYGKAQYVLNNMDDSEWLLYQKIYRSFLPYLPKPKYIIYLKVSLVEVKRRIAGRNRSFERQIPDGYLELLEMLNEAWMKKEADGMKIITIESDKLNLVSNKKDIEEFTKKIRRQIH